MDNLFVEGSHTPISRRDEKGNTYQLRTLQNGEQYEVLKNFPAKEDFKEILHELPCKWSSTAKTYFWGLSIQK